MFPNPQDALPLPTRPSLEQYHKLAKDLVKACTAGAPYEAAAQAIVDGDEETLQRLLRERPELIRARSEREHNATLLHYVSANGVEGYRQKTPNNIVRITEILLNAGAEVDAEADVYGGGATALGLVATSAHPRGAGVQIPLIQLLLDHGAQIEHPNLAGNAHAAVFACLANGCPEAARYLADHGARLDFVSAAGVGRLDVVESFFDPATKPEREMAMRYAAAYGKGNVVTFMLDRGVDVDAHTGDGETALFYAVLSGHHDVIQLLLARGARPGVRTRYGGDMVGAALWRAGHGGDGDLYLKIIDVLVAAGGAVPDRHPPINETVDAALARRGSVADESRYWWGEEPRR